MRRVFALLATLAMLAVFAARPVPASADPPTVAVVAVVSDGLDPEFTANFDPGKALTTLLTDRLTNIGKVSVLERENVERIFDEQKLAQSADFSTQDAVKLGHMVGANYLIVGRVVHLDKVGTNSGGIGGLLSSSPINVGGTGATAEKVRCEIGVRVLDASTGRVLRAFTFDKTQSGTSFTIGDGSADGSAIYSSQQFTSSVVGKLLDAAADDMAHKISDMTFASAAARASLEAIIIALDGNNVIINKGSADGVTSGAYFNTFHRVAAADPTTGRTITTDVPDGEIQIISVSPNSSVGRKVQGSPAVRGIARLQ